MEALRIVNLMLRLITIPENANVQLHKKGALLLLDFEYRCILLELLPLSLRKSWKKSGQICQEEMQDRLDSFGLVWTRLDSFGLVWNRLESWNPLESFNSLVHTVSRLRVHDGAEPQRKPRARPEGNFSGQSIPERGRGSSGGTEPYMYYLPPREV